MAWWEWVPVVSTVGHALADPPGRKVTDYAECACTVEDCEGLGAPAATIKCNGCVNGKLRDYILAWIGGGAPSDFVEGALGLTLVKFAEALGKVMTTKYGGRVALAATGAGAALTADGVIDAGIQISKAIDMWQAANSAKDQYCVCR